MVEHSGSDVGRGQEICRAMEPKEHAAADQTTLYFRYNSIHCGQSRSSVLPHVVTYLQEDLLLLFFAKVGHTLAFRIKQRQRDL